MAWEVLSYPHNRRIYQILLYFALCEKAVEEDCCFEYEHWAKCDFCGKVRFLKYLGITQPKGYEQWHCQKKSRSMSFEYSRVYNKPILECHLFNDDD